jgi:hypothetical protein
MENLYWDLQPVVRILTTPQIHIVSNFSLGFFWITSSPFFKPPVLFFQPFPTGPFSFFSQAGSLIYIITHFFPKSLSLFLIFFTRISLLFLSLFLYVKITNVFWLLFFTINGNRPLGQASEAWLKS